MAQRRKHTHDITKFVMREISLVPEGDNDGAMVVIAKRRAPDSGVGLIAKLRATAPQIEGIAKALDAAGENGNAEAADAADILKGLGGTIMDIEQRIAEIEKSLADITKERDAALATVATITKERDDALAAVEKAKGEVAATGSDEDIIKSIADPAVRAIVEKSRNEAAAATAAVEKLNTAAETATFIAKARDTKVGGDVEAIGGLMFRVAKGKTTADDATLLEGVLKAAGEQSKTLFQPIGKSGGNGGASGQPGDSTALVELNKAADDIRKTKPHLTKEAAFGEAMDANPALYDRYLDETRRHG